MKARWFFTFVTGARLLATTAAEQGPPDPFLEAGECRAAVAWRLHHQGYRQMHVNGMVVRNNLEVGDTITGVVRADGRYVPKQFGFTCSMDPNNGSMRFLHVGK
jgi:hypothetical protein